MKTSFIHDIQELMSNIMAFRYSDLEKERKNCQYLLDIGEREKDTYSIAFAHTYFGDYYIAQSDSENCGIHLNLARRLSEENGFQDLMLRINNLYGICYESLALSIGYSNQISTEIESAGALVDAADQGLYHSKSIGRNSYSKHSL